MATSESTYTPTEIDNRESFFNEGRFQVVCANCGATGDFDVHHVLYRQACRKEGAPEWSPDNALRICDRPITGCHGTQHGSMGLRIKLTALRDENIAFCAHFLGAGKAYNYLTRRYSGSDPRVDALLEVA